MAWTDFFGRTGAVSEPNAAQTTFNTRIAEGLTGMNRGSLRYLEKRGVVEPARREGSEYRVYSLADINRIVGLDIIINSGIAASDAWPDEDVPGTVDDARGLLDACRARNAETLAWNHAVEESLGRYGRLYAADSMYRPRLCEFERRLVWFNQAKPGDELTVRSVRGGYSKLSPVASVTCVYDADMLEGSGVWPGRWGVSIPTRLLGAVDPGRDLELDAAETIEGAACVCVPIRLSSAASFEVDEDAAVRASIRSFVAQEGLLARGPVVLADYLPVGQAVYATLNALVG